MAGKRVEKPLMETFCKLFDVKEEYYRIKISGREIGENIGFDREVDFYLFNPNGEKNYKCEVKLMGEGNPESADAVIARDSKVFIADKLSYLNKRQLDSLGIEWLELRSENGFRKFGSILSRLGIPHEEFIGDTNSALDILFSS